MGAIAGVVEKTKTALSEPEKTLMLRENGGVERLEFPGGTFLHSLQKKEDQNKFCFQKTVGREVYHLVYCGSIFNKKELQSELKCSDSAGEMILSAFLTWGESCLSHLNGAFSVAIWEQTKKELFLGRDQMGLKPLFYHVTADGILFASEIKTILAVPGFKPILNRTGALELLMLGPGRIPGSGILKGISELEPGCWARYSQGKLKIKRYWKLQDGIHLESVPATAEHIRNLLLDAVERQTEGVPYFGTFLSGGLDSSVLSAMAANKNRNEMLPTFSVDYENNSKYFVPGKFQPDSDNQYVKIMTDFLKSDHHQTVLSPEILVNELYPAVIARDYPGMGDVDASLLAFCREVKTHVPMVLSGECADEIFGGYPWFRDPAVRAKEGFPWAQNTALRKSLLNFKASDADDFVMDLYRDACSECDILPEIQGEERKIKELVNLNMRFFMQTLVERNERMSAYAGLQIRVPFCDVRIAEYLYQIPWRMKEFGGREKGLLRLAVKGLLPEEIRLRKKSPYPKTYDPRYENMIIARLRDLLVEDRPIWYLISREKIQKILEDGLPEPWYGQLMKRAQFAAWVIQIDFWLNHYKIALKL